MELTLDNILRILNIFLLLPLGVGVNWLREWRRENKRRDKHTAEMEQAQHDALMALVRDRILQSGRYFCRLGAIPYSIKESLIKMGEAYLAMGGNGEGHKMIDRIKALPIDDQVLERRETNEEDI